MDWLTERKEYWQPSPGGCRAVLVSFGFLVLGFLTLMIMKAMLNIEQNAVLVALFLLAPVLIFLILSGKLLEINAGGVSAKFNEAAQRPLFNEDEMNATPIDEERVAIFMKRGLAELQAMLQSVSTARYMVLTVTLGKGGYNRPDLLDYLRALSQHEYFTFLAILETDEKLFGYISGRQALQILELEEEMARRGLLGPSYIDFVMAINQGLKGELLRRGLIKATVKPTDTNISVLKKMTELKTNVLIVADDDRMIKGVVEREQVLSKLMLALTK